MTTQEIYKIAEETAAQFATEVAINIWKEQRVYLTRPNESIKYQAVGYIRLSDMKIFPAFGIKARTKRDRDAADFLQKVADAISAGEAPKQEETEFKSMLPW